MIEHLDKRPTWKGSMLNTSHVSLNEGEVPAAIESVALPEPAADGSYVSVRSVLEQQARMKFQDPRLADIAAFIARQEVETAEVTNKGGEK
jgi:hypothetical protein